MFQYQHHDSHVALVVTAAVLINMIKKKSKIII